MTEIGQIVGNEKTYTENHDGINYYIPNLFSFNGFYSSYQRNGFLEWEESDVFTITSMSNITDLGLRYFVFEERKTKDGFFKEICRNGTLTPVKNYNFDARGEWSMIWWESPIPSKIELYEYH